MSYTAIQAENISKKYNLGTISSGTLFRDLNMYWAKMRGKANPYAKLGENGEFNESEHWALQDVNFQINQGEAVGIIGRNGAGKSTLLKILSRVTSPTSGEIKIKGRVASLLEVGTGFHPEMTGRENIYLNGAILGMTHSEIKKKFDEIVDFAGVEKYIDTPVKRYSSGMYVRLAFAVAAHLEPEILIVDEVLAVGDAEFQKKCLGKMNDVSKREGRTILFVSHNMVSIQNLCKTCIYLTNGQVDTIGETSSVISKYLTIKSKNFKSLLEITNRKGNGNLMFSNALLNGKNFDHIIGIESFSDINIEIQYLIAESVTILNCKIDIGINNNFGDRVAWLSSESIGAKIDKKSGKTVFNIKNLPLAPGDYTMNLYCELNNELADWISEVLHFKVIEKDYYNSGKTILSNQGNILLNYSQLI